MILLYLCGILLFIGGTQFWFGIYLAKKRNIEVNNIYYLLFNIFFALGGVALILFWIQKTVEHFK